MAELLHKYAWFPLGIADASVVAAAERLELAEVATLDNRHFRKAAWSSRHRWLIGLAGRCVGRNREARAKSGGRLAGGLR